MARGGKRPGAGRKKGSLTRCKEDRQAERNKAHLYAEKSVKRKELKAAERKLRTQIARVSDSIADKVKDPERKQFIKVEKPTKAERASYRHLFGRVPRQTYAWFAKTALNANASVSDVRIALAKCAMSEVVFSMPKQFSPLERKFYAAEVRKQRRLKQIEMERHKLRNEILNDRDALHYSLDPEELKV